MMTILASCKRFLGGFPCGASGKEPTCQCIKDKVQSLGWEDALKEGMATHSSTVA